MTLLECYLQHLRQIRATGEAVKETSYYPAVAELFNAAGHDLKPKVSCAINLKNRGAGIPDGGFFSENQLRAIVKRDGEAARDNPFAAQLPERGVLEVKGAADHLETIAKSEQVARYLGRYGQVLVSNLRQWILVTKDGNGQAKLGEKFSLCESQAQLWSSQSFGAEVGARFEEYIKRALMHAAPLENPPDLAWFLASYARDARLRLEAADNAALHELKSELEAALGLKFEGERGEHFFRSTLVQTLFYGIFSAWIGHCRDNPDAPFDWKLAQWSLHVPMIRTLYEQVATRSRLGALGLVEPLQWASDALNRVQRAAFFERFRQEEAVQYFYEPFLEAFDPSLRRDLGVWYTPPEIVRYMVERVDRVLRDELGRPDGLADEGVYVLDPCCGTGAYPVEVLRRIAQTLRERGEPNLLGADLKRAATTRVFGFEILPAPFVIAHWQIGNLLADEGAALGDGQRAGIYLTNALTGWDEQPQRPLPSPEMQQERDLSNEVKRDKKILVILGNPPYNAFSGTSPDEEGDLVAPYKHELGTRWGIKKYNLDDLYVRFFRVAERRLTEHLGGGHTDEGIICFISNFSYLRDPSFVVMRQRWLGEFDSLHFDILNGDSRETGKLTPEGKPDPSVFSTPFNREGIRVGTAIGLMVRQKRAPDEVRATKVLSRQFWGQSKREELMQSLASPAFDAQYQAARPSISNRFSFRPDDVSDDYLSWPKLTELCERSPSNGLMEKRGGALISTQRETLETRMRAYFDEATDWPALEALQTGLTRPAAGFEPKAARLKVLQSEGFQSENLVRYLVRPFDIRWCYYSAVNPLWNRSRPSLWAEAWQGNAFLMSRPAGIANPEELPLCFTTILGDNDAVRGHAYYFPMQLRSVPDGDSAQQKAMQFEMPTRANLSQRARKYFEALQLPDPDGDAEAARLLWWHALAIGYAPAYRAEHADGLRGDWPRVPLPIDAETLRASGKLGQRVAALLDTEGAVAGVTAGSIEARWRSIGVLSRTEGGQIQQEDGDLRVKAGWGHGGQGGVTMPGRGKVIERPRTTTESEALSGDEWGQSTLDVFLNDRVYWSNLPPRVWEFTIGGYAVLKKWLSYREYAVLKRDLTLDEAREITSTARRLAALCDLESELDLNYQACAGAVWSWSE